MGAAGRKERDGDKGEARRKGEGGEGKVQLGDSPHSKTLDPPLKRSNYLYKL